MVCMHVCVRALFAFVHAFNACVQYVYARARVHMRGWSARAIGLCV